MTARRRWTVALPWALLALLLALRVPSLVQPLGPDQSLYAYVAQEIDRGGWPYLDAWDQKPPGIHLIYAMLLAVWPDDSAIALADLLAAACVALLLVPLGTWWSGGHRAAGWTAACLFLLLGDPAWQRLGGLRVRAQCEVFIAVTVTLGVWLVVRRQRQPVPSLVMAGLAGACVGYAALLKYPAAVYGLVPLLVLTHRSQAGGPRPAWGSLVAFVAGAAVPLAVVAGLYWSVGGLRDLFDATVSYNLRYSGTTYSGPADFARYLLTFPIQHARVDGLWLLGGAGALVLLPRLGSDSRSRILFVWLFCGLVAIAVNGSRGLPQYFLQASPAWALAAGLGAYVLFSKFRHAGRAIVALIAVVAVIRVVEVDNFARALVRDTRMMWGVTSADAYIASFGERRGDKFRLASTIDLARHLASRTSPADRVLVYGFAPGAYVYAQRRSASRFFWSAPVADGFNAGKRGYGPEGLLDDLARRHPAVVAIQTDPSDIAASFWREPPLTAWLQANYERAPAVDVFDVWIARRTNTP